MRRERVEPSGRCEQRSEPRTQEFHSRGRDEAVVNFAYPMPLRHVGGSLLFVAAAPLELLCAGTLAAGRRVTSGSFPELPTLHTPNLHITLP